MIVDSYVTGAGEIVVKVSKEEGLEKHVAEEAALAEVKEYYSSLCVDEFREGEHTDNTWVFHIEVSDF